MELDIDLAVGTADAMEKSVPWDLTIVLAGEKRKVLPLTVDDLLRLEAMQRISNAAEGRSAVASLLEDKTVDLSSLRLEQLGCVIVGVMLYFQERLKKKPQAWAKAFQMQMGSQAAKGSIATG